MSERREISRWSLSHAGNRVALAVLIGLVIGGLCNSGAELGTALHIAVLLAVTGLTYALLTLMRRR